MGWGDEPPKYKVGDVVYLYPLLDKPHTIEKVFPPEYPRHHEYRYKIKASPRWRVCVFAEPLLLTLEEAVARKLRE